ncbi:unnamed protein product [Rotaria sordida]|uniref:Uncharacterized protein n=1 Tax=Rotaria sordida TaxID=392033 RepID=A0A819C0M4_9BILA|nr:unnamed protein product [Rotaria sordida]CAF3810838.1 unnamed protein product [Rotaria sordida]
MSSDLDVVFNNPKFDEASPFGGYKSKTDPFSADGSWPWSKIFFVGLMVLCIIGIILAVLFIIFSKKFNKNIRTTTTSTIVGAKEAGFKDISSNPTYKPVPNV